MVLVASLDDQNVREVQELKQRIRQILRKLTPSSEPRASIESDSHTLQCVSPSARPSQYPFTPGGGDADRNTPPATSSAAN